MKAYSTRLKLKTENYRGLRHEFILRDDYSYSIDGYSLFRYTYAELRSLCAVMPDATYKLRE